MLCIQAAGKNNMTVEVVFAQQMVDVPFIGIARKRRNASIVLAPHIELDIGIALADNRQRLQ